MTAETARQRLLRLRNQAALAAVRLQGHRTRCRTCARLSGVYAGYCVAGNGLRRELEAARAILHSFAELF